MADFVGGWGDIGELDLQSLYGENSVILHIVEDNQRLPSGSGIRMNGGDGRALPFGSRDEDTPENLFPVNPVTLDKEKQRFTGQPGVAVNKSINVVDDPDFQKIFSSLAPSSSLPNFAALPRLEIQPVYQGLPHGLPLPQEEQQQHSTADDGSRMSVDVKPAYQRLPHDLPLLEEEQHDATAEDGLGMSETMVKDPETETEAHGSNGLNTSPCQSTENVASCSSASKRGRKPNPNKRKAPEKKEKKWEKAEKIMKMAGTPIDKTSINALNARKNRMKKKSEFEKILTENTDLKARTMVLEGKCEFLEGQVTHWHNKATEAETKNKDLSNQVLVLTQEQQRTQVLFTVLDSFRTDGVAQHQLPLYLNPPVAGPPDMDNPDLFTPCNNNPMQ